MGRASFMTDKILSCQADLYRYALKLTADIEEADDLLQETNLKALSQLDKYTTDIHFKGWLFTIMHNTFINIVKAKRECYPIELQYTLSTEEMVSSYIQLNEVRKEIERLPDMYRIPFTMSVAGYSYREIQARMNIPISTIKSRIFVCRDLLRKQIKY